MSALASCGMSSATDHPWEAASNADYVITSHLLHIRCWCCRDASLLPHRSFIMEADGARLGE
jgi:hypothetical protein